MQENGLYLAVKPVFNPLQAANKQTVYFSLTYALFDLWQQVAVVNKLVGIDISNLSVGRHLELSSLKHARNICEMTYPSGIPT